MKVFVDTLAWIALFVKTDVNHEKVTKIYQEYKKQNSFFYSSDYVLSELYTRMMYDHGSETLMTVQRKIDELVANGLLVLLDIDSALFEQSKEIMIKFGEHQLSFVDATIYNCMKKFKLDEVFSLDSDFKKIGLQVS